MEINRFQEGKTYIFVAKKVAARSVNKWAELIDGEIVKVKQPSLGFITMEREGKKPKEMPVFPRFCKELKT